MGNKELCEPGCCDGWSSSDGEAAHGCNWSPVCCSTCGHKGRDDSC